MTLELSNLKPLTSTQYDEAQRRAVERVKARIGNKPTRAQFVREYGAIMSLLDWLALAVFVPALLVSSIHIMNHMGALALSAPGADEMRRKVNRSTTRQPKSMFIKRATSICRD